MTALNSTASYRPNSVPLPDSSASACELASSSASKTEDIAKKCFDTLPGSPSSRFWDYHSASRSPSPYFTSLRMPSIQEDAVPTSPTEKLPELANEKSKHQYMQNEACDYFFENPKGKVWKAYQRGAPIPLELLRLL